MRGLRANLVLPALGLAGRAAFAAAAAIAIAAAG